MTISSTTQPKTLDWLLEREDPGARYLALRDLLKLPAGDPELEQARAAAHRHGPIAVILENMQPEGWWGKVGPGYGPKYYSTVWSLINLGQLGGSVESDPRIRQACLYYLENGYAAGGQFTYSGTAAGTFDCLQGNMAGALLDLGMADPRLDEALEWMARTTTGEGMAAVGERKSPVRYTTYKCGPDFACSANNYKPCAWGGVKVMLAFSKLTTSQRTPMIERAIQRGADFLFSVDPAEAAYPTPYGQPPSRDWWLFGFPLFYITDLLQLVEALGRLGHGADPRLGKAIEYILSQQDADGRWALKYHYNNKTWMHSGVKGKPNKWVTLRALTALGFCAAAR
jgi:hypothetical protein